MNRAPVVTVLMPAFNAERFVDSAVKSILAQTYDDFELLAIDDGSTDKTVAILRRHARDGRIRVIEGGRRGLVAALNHGLAEARGVLIARMDADDVSHPERLADQVKFLQSRAECIVVGCGVQTVDPDGVLILKSTPQVTAQEIDRRHMDGLPSPLAHPSVMMRRDAVLDAGGYDDRYTHAEDYDLWLRLAERGTIEILPQVLFSYRVHDRSVCHTQSVAQRRSLLAARRAAWIRRGLGEPPELAGAANGPQGAAALRRTWALIAHSAGLYGSARRLGMKAFLFAPASPPSWWVLGTTLLGSKGHLFRRSLRKIRSGATS